MDLSFRVGRDLAVEEERRLMPMLEEAVTESLILPRWCQARVLFNDGEMLHVRIKINNTPSMLRAYMKRTVALGEALGTALKEFNDGKNNQRRDHGKTRHDNGR